MASSIPDALNGVLLVHVGSSGHFEPTRNTSKQHQKYMAHLDLEQPALVAAGEARKHKKPGYHGVAWKPKPHASPAGSFKRSGTKRTRLFGRD